MGKASRNKVEQYFDVNIIVESTVQLYEELARRKSVRIEAVRACPDHKI